MSLKSSPRSTNHTETARLSRIGYALLILVLIGATVVWLRNRDILSDLYDYSSMITSAGKVVNGLTPYTDFRSTMQSACYVLPALVEKFAGSNYLGLTWGGLLLSLGGAVMVFALLRPRCGALTAAVLTAAITWAGFAQHVVIFYNPLGLLCLTIIVLGLADPPRKETWRSLRTWLIIGALIIGGANKINFQALTLGLGGILILRAGVAAEMSWKGVFTWWGALLGFGLIVPIGLELLWTGATPEEWYFNVIGLAEARVGFVSKIFSLEAYLTPTYTLHKHVLIQPLHTIGLVILFIVAILAWRQISRNKAETGAPNALRLFWLRAVLVFAVMAAGFGGVLLTITNIEIITLTSLGVLVGAVAIAISFGIMGRPSTKWVLNGGALIWIIVGGYAAWTGSRVLYARGGTDRTTFVRLENAPPSLRYFEGVRLDANLRNSLLLTAKELELIQSKQGDLSRVLFGPSLEWMERSHPESIMRGMPVWYDLGTSLQTTDGPWLIERFESKKIDRIFVHPDWESWPDDFQIWLNENFRTIPLGKVVKLYERRDDLQAAHAPLTFADNNALAMLDRTGSQIHVRTTRVPVDNPPHFTPSPWGEFFGTTGSWTWWWDLPTRVVEGMFVAVAQSGLNSTVPFNWRIIADPEGTPEVLLSKEAMLSPDQPDFRAPFRVESNGRSLAFEINVPEGTADAISSGWRAMRILHAGDPIGDLPPPGLNLTEPAFPMDLADGSVFWLRVNGSIEPEHSVKLSAEPFEAWKQGPKSGGSWQATLEIEPQPGPGRVDPVVMLVWCKSSRLEIQKQELVPTNSGTFTLTGSMPEPEGWLGVVVRPIEQGKPINARLRLVRWSK